MKVAWTPLSTGRADGYSRISLELARGLINQDGYQVLRPSESGWDVAVIVGLPVASLFDNLRKRQDVVYHTMIEVNPLPPNWADILNCAGAVWTPSQYCKALFEENGVNTPILVTPYGFDPTWFFPASDKDRAQRTGPMRFGVYADAFGSRKQVARAVSTYIAADLPDAILEVKVNDQAAPTSIKDATGATREDITLYTEPWSNQKVGNWLRSLDCLIYLSAGEGFGLQPLEAMACGTPVICGYNTGMMEYLSADNALLIHTHSPAVSPTYSLRFKYEAFYTVPDFDEAVTLIRWAYDNRFSHLLLFSQRAAHDAALWTWDRAAKAAADALSTFYERL